MRMFLRFEHGGYPVTVGGEGRKRTYQVRRGTKVEMYKTTGELLQGLYGKKVYISHDRYFRLGIYSGPRVGLSLVQWYEDKQIGIDLEHRGKEVAKILFSCFSGAVERLRMEPEDILQEVYRGLVTRNQGDCPWDPRKSSFSHYVYMVCRCVLSNLKKKQDKNSFEHLGVLSYRLGDNQQEDAADSKVEESVTSYQECMEVLESIEDLQLWFDKTQDMGKKHTQIAKQIIPLVYKGYKRKEIADEIGCDMSVVGRAIVTLRSATQEWHSRRAVLGPNSKI